ncbi:unnamed protein product [Caenorhabditis nigoni]
MLRLLERKREESIWEEKYAQASAIDENVKDLKAREAGLRELIIEREDALKGKDLIAAQRSKDRFEKNMSDALHLPTIRGFLSDEEALEARNSSIYKILIISVETLENHILTHLAVIVIPMGYTFFSFLLRYRNQILVNLSTIIITFHGTITSISSIAINRPFRNHVKSWLCPKRLRNRRSSTNLNVLTVSSSWF